jgi:ATP diphosphatase
VIGVHLCSLVFLERHLFRSPQPEERAANGKFERRFRFIEQALREAGRNMEDCALDELDALWGEAKKLEKQQAPDC